MKVSKCGILMIQMIMVLAITSFVFSMDLIKEGGDWKYQREKVFNVDAKGAFQTEDLVGDIVVTAWSKKQVKIIETIRVDTRSEKDAQEIAKRFEADFVQKGDLILITHSGNYGRWNRIDNYYQVWVPENFACDLETEGGDLEIEGVQGEVRLKTGGGDIELENLGGPVASRSGGGDVSASSIEKELSIQTGGGDIDVEDTKSDVAVQTGGGDVELSRIKGAASIQTGGGDIDIEDCNEISIQTGGGDIDVMHVMGDVSIRTGGGDIDVQEIIGQCSISTGGGEVYGKTIEGAVQVTTGGGSVELSDIKGALDVQTGGGDVYAEVTLKDFSVRHDIEIETGCGDIDLVIPANFPASVRMVLETKERDWDDYTIKSDFPLKMDTQSKGWKRRIIATGDLNGGGDPVRIYSQCGDIHLRKGP